MKNENNEPIQNDNVKRLFTYMLTSGKSGVTPIQPSIFIVERARDLNWEHGLNVRAMDGIHLASALEVGCAEFITTDEKIHSKAEKLNERGITVIYGNKTNLLPNKYRQLNIG